MKELYRGPEICRNCGYEFRDHRAKNKACPLNDKASSSVGHWSETQLFEPKKTAAHNRRLLTSLAKTHSKKCSIPQTFVAKEANPMPEKRRRYHIEFDVDIPGDVRPAQVENWIRSRCGDKGKLRRDNPLYAETVDPICGTFKVTPRREASNTIEEKKE